MADVDIKIKLQAEQAKAVLNQLNSQFQKLDSTTNAAKKSTDSFKNSVSGLQDAGKKAGQGLKVADIALASFVGNITSRIVSSAITGVINGFSALVQSGRDFEDGLVSVGKTTGISGKQLQDLGDDISALAGSIPLATNELLTIATVAGQLGLKSSQDIVQFTETLGKLQLATDIVGEEGAQSVAQILTITGELEQNGTQNIDKFGNVITRLGNNFAATEAQILRVANRVAQGTAAFNVSSEDILGIATALKATGSEAEASGTAIQKTFRLIGEATQEGGEKLLKFSEAAGLTSDEFVNLFEKDPTELFVKLATNLGQTSQGGAELNNTLKQLGLSDERLVRTLNPLIARYETLQQAISDARKESASKTALAEEAAKATDTLSGDIQRLSSAFDQLAKELFEEFGPTLRSAVQQITSFIDLVKNNRQTIVGAFTAIGAAAGVMWLGITGPVGLALAGLSALSIGLGIVGDSIREAREKAEDNSRSIQEMGEAYRKADSDTQTFIDTYSEVIDATGNAANNLVELDMGLEKTSKNYVELGTQAEKASEKITKSAERIRFFEQEKTEALKQFFSEEERARLESNFAILKSEKEREAFTRIFASEGTKRQREAYLAKLGLDKATIESERQKQEELTKLRSAQEQFEQEQAQRRQQLRDAEQMAEQEKLIAEEALRLFQQEQQQIFLDDRLVGLQGYFTREEEARIQAAINAEENEIKKQTLINKALEDGLNRRLELEARANRDRARNESLLANQRVGIARETSNLITAIAGRESKAAFAISKAVAFAENIVRTQQAMAAVSAAFAWNPPLAASLIAAEKAQGVLRGATILATAVQGFEQGGIVGGTSFTGDRVQARVNSGEMILNRQQQAQLFNMANGGGAGEKMTELNITVQSVLDGEIVAESVSKQVANGLVLGEVQ